MQQKSDTRPRIPEAAAQVAARLACSLGRRDEVPNVVLGQALAKHRDAEGVASLVALLAHKEYAADAIKALYEAGAVAPDLLVPHAAVFLRVLTSPNNRLVWGAATALAAVAKANPDALWPAREQLLEMHENGSVITKDQMLAALSAVAGSTPTRGRALAKQLAQMLEACRAKDVPKYAAAVVPVLPAADRELACAMLETRLPALRPSAQAKVRRLLAQVAR